MILYEGPVWNGNSTIQDHFVQNNNLGAETGLDDSFSALAGFITSGVDPFPAPGLFLRPISPWAPSSIRWVCRAFEPGGEWLDWSYLTELNVFYPGDQPGCTYAFACNFDASANVDDGSCELESCRGCMYATAENTTRDRPRRRLLCLLARQVHARPTWTATAQPG